MSLSGGSTLPDLNPTNKKKWLEKLREHELDPSSISVSDISKTSASKLTERAYLQIKVLRKNHSITQFSIRDYVSLSQLEFMNSASWQEHFAEHLEPYFDLFEQPVHHLRSMKKPGLFAAAKYFQSLVFTEINLGASPVLADETDGVAVNTRPTTRSQSRQRGRAETHEAHSSRDQLYGTPPRERSASTGSGRGPGPVTVPTTPIVPLTARIAHIYLGGGNGNEPSSSSAPLALPATPWSPATASQSAATGDEQIVNFALVLLLHATIVPIRQLRYVDWTPSRIALRLGSLPPPDDGGAVAGSERGRTSHALAARTDGLLRAQDGTQFPLAILECKAYVRSANQRAVEWQEGAQLACLVADCPQVPLANYRNHGLLTSPRGSNLKRLAIDGYLFQSWLLTGLIRCEGAFLYLKTVTRCGSPLHSTTRCMRAM